MDAAESFAAMLNEYLGAIAKLDDLRASQIAELQQQVGSVVRGMQAITESYALRTELDDLRVEVRELRVEVRELIAEASNPRRQ